MVRSDGAVTKALRACISPIFVPTAVISTKVPDAIIVYIKIAHGAMVIDYALAEMVHT